MKKLILNLLFLTITSIAFANPFNFDEKSIQAEFQQVNAVEQLVIQHKITDYDNLKSVSPELSTNFSTNNSFFEDDGYDLPLGIPPFFWGCCFSVLGIVLVAVITNNDRKSINSAAIGCLVTTGVTVISYVILIFSGALASSFSY